MTFSNNELHALRCWRSCARSTKWHNGNGQMGDTAKEKWKGWESKQQNVRIGQGPTNCIALIYIARHDIYDVFKSGASYQAKSSQMLSINQEGEIRDSRCSNDWLPALEADLRVQFPQGVMFYTCLTIYIHSSSSISLPNSSPFLFVSIFIQV